MCKIMEEKKIVLCGANAYEKKYYFNKEFDKIPESIKEELHIICVLFTEEVGGIFTFCFDEEGNSKPCTRYNNVMRAIEQDGKEIEISNDMVYKSKIAKEVIRDAKIILKSNLALRKD